MSESIGLGDVEIFSDMNADELRMISERLHRYHLEKDQVLFHEGDAGQELYIVESGRLGVSVRAEDGSDLDIAEFGAGDFFGEMSVFEQEARSATCYTKSTSTLLSLHESDILTLIDSFPGSAMKILMRMLTITRNRLDNTGSFLSDMVQWGEAARKRSITDELTGFYNRRYLDESLPSVVKEATDRQEKMAICMLDLDHFRVINEELSHAIGDQAIKEAVGVLRNVLLPSDIAVRYGGDEFVLIMPNTSRPEAEKRAWDVCSGVAALDLLSTHPCSIERITTSIGLACLPDHGSSANDLAEAADRALYEAKESGRNRVVTCSGGEK
jgi:diguanylate cyclase (GGDEF)-like protein